MVSPRVRAEEAELSLTARSQLGEWKLLRRIAGGAPVVVAEAVEGAFVERGAGHQMRPRGQEDLLARACGRGRPDVGRERSDDQSVRTRLVPIDDLLHGRIGDIGPVLPHDAPVLQVVDDRDLVEGWVVDVPDDRGLGAGWVVWAARRGVAVVAEVGRELV